jgi:DNA modification methylase
MDRLTVIYKKVSELIPYINNPRNNEAGVDKVASSINSFGFKVPIIVDKDNEIIAGHTRLLAAKKLGMEEVPCIVASDLTEAQIKAFRIADNKVADFTTWDNEMLAIEFEALEELNFDLLATGFDMDEIELILGDDEEPEAEEDDFDVDGALKEETISKEGDLFLLGKHRLYCGDSTSDKDVQTLMDGKLARMVFTDPPWNVNYGAVEDGNAQGYKPRTILNDFMGTEDFKEFMNSAFRNMSRASEPGCMTYVVMSAQEWGNCMLTLAMNDYHWSSTIIWNKDRLVLSRKDYHTKYEPLWYGWKEGEARLCPLDDRKQSDVWDIERPSKSDDHPTMKPVELVARTITNSSKPKDLVLDFFGGSGTTLIAAEQLNRTCYMMELDPRYMDVIVKRYIELKESDKDVYLIRNGKKTAYSKIANINPNKKNQS